MATEMNANNTHSTDIDRHQEERIDPIHTKHLLGMIASGVLIALVCVFGIVWILLNSEVIDKIKPEVQLIIFAVALGAFGIFRMIIWIKEKL